MVCFQQDAQEFLRYLHEDVNKFTEKPKSILREIDDKLKHHENLQEFWSNYL